MVTFTVTKNEGFLTAKNTHHGNPWETRERKKWNNNEFQHSQTQNAKFAIVVTNTIRLGRSSTPVLMISYRNIISTGYNNSNL